MGRRIRFGDDLLSQARDSERVGNDRRRDRSPIRRHFRRVGGKSHGAAEKALAEKRLPWILTTLCEAITKMGGASIEGIFRIAADTDELSFIKLVIDCINFDLLDEDGDILELLNHNSDEPVDVHVFACLLKQWFPLVEGAHCSQ